MRWYSEQDLWIIEKAETIVIELLFCVGLGMELAVDTLGEGIDLGVPTERDRGEIPCNIICPYHIKDSCFNCQCLFSLNHS
jgi:hypothetical protein